MQNVWSPALTKRPHRQERVDDLQFAVCREKGTESLQAKGVDRDSVLAKRAEMRGALIEEREDDNIVPARLQATGQVHELAFCAAALQSSNQVKYSHRDVLHLTIWRDNESLSEIILT